MRVMVVLIVGSALGTVLKGLEKRLVELGIRIRIDTIQTTPSLRALSGGARGVMVIVAGNGHGGTSSNPGRD